MGKCAKCKTDLTWLINSLSNNVSDQDFFKAVKVVETCSQCRYEVKRYFFEKECLERIKKCEKK